MQIQFYVTLLVHGYWQSPIPLKLEQYFVEPQKTLVPKVPHKQLFYPLFVHVFKAF